MTGGMDNPVDVVFTPGGERIFTTTFFHHPGGGKRDGLIHAVYGGIYGKEHDPLYEHPWTSPNVMPVLAHMGAAAPAGLTRYESRVFGPEYQDNLFACQFNMHKISRHVLEPDGATFKSRDSDFLVSSNFDFHPTDVLEDADGSLLVVDTGGWYKLCCPTSQLHKPDVLGAIYRIRRRGATPVDDPRGLKLAWSKLPALELVKRLDDPRPVVRKRTIQALAAMGRDALYSLAGVVIFSKSVEAKRNAVWAASQIQGEVPRGVSTAYLDRQKERSRGVVRTAFKDHDESVRQVALHATSLWRDRDAVPDLLGLLQVPSLHNRRAAAEALGRIGDKSVVPALLEVVGQPADRALEHSLTFALIEIADRDGTAAGLKSANPLTRRAALVALDQMGGGLQASMITADLSSADPGLKETAWWIASRHPEWGGELSGILRDRLAAKLTPAERGELVRQLARFARVASVQEWLAERLRDTAAPREARRNVLQAMAQAGLRQTPAVWVADLTQLLTSGNDELTADAVATVRAWPAPKQPPDKLVAVLLQLGKNAAVPAAVRLNALAAVPGGLTAVEPDLFAFLCAHLGAEEPVAVRAVAVDVLSRSKLNGEQLMALTDSLKSVGPLEVDRLLDPFAQATDEQLGHNLIAALQASPARSVLRVEMLKPRLAKFGPTVQKEAEVLYAALDADAAKQRARLEELLAGLKNGDIRRGQAVFKSEKAACAACHAIGYLGGTVGPDLTRIGGIRTERDLLESIAFPSASFVRSYEPVQVTTKDGKVHNGVIRKDAPDELVLATGVNQEVRLARSDVEEIQPSKVSVMPSGLDQQLSPQELADLVAFLKACK
jgi:putative heme-binding domain-containing protein